MIIRWTNLPLNVLDGNLNICKEWILTFEHDIKHNEYQ